MESIKASALQAAVSLTAALVLNDGKYEQWQKLFGKQLNDTTGLKWTDKGWEEHLERGETIHTLIFSCKTTLNKQTVDILIFFKETATGYTFLSCHVGDTDIKPIAKADNGKDLLAGILYKLVQMGAVSAGEYPAPLPDKAVKTPAPTKPPRNEPATKPPSKPTPPAVKPGQVERDGVVYTVVIAKTGFKEGDRQNPQFSIAFSSKEQSYYIENCFWYESGYSQGTNRSVQGWYLQTEHFGGEGNGGGLSTKPVPSVNGRMTEFYIAAFGTPDGYYGKKIDNSLREAKGPINKSTLVRLAS